MADFQTVVRGEAFTYQPTAIGEVDSWSASGLPSGLSINSATGEITGTVTAAVGNHDYTITAHGPAGNDDQVITMGVWGGYFGIESDAALVDEAIDVVYFNLASAPNSFWDNVDAAGADVRVTNDDGSVRYAAHFVNFSVGSKTGILWFNTAGDLSISVDTTFRILAGNPDAEAPYKFGEWGSAAVFSGYTVAQLCEDDPSNGFVDEAGRVENVTAGGTWIAGDREITLFGMGYHFQDDDHHLDLSAPTYGTTYTIEAMSHYDVVNENNVITAYRSTSAGNPIKFQFDQISDDHRFVVRDDAGNIAAATLADVLNTTGYKYIAGRRNGNTVSSWHQGTKATDGTATFGAITVDKHIIGANVAGSSTIASHFKGIIAWLLISATARSDNYISTRNANVNNHATFWTAGAWTEITGNRRRRILCGAAA